jgi:hypothetical protein
MPVAAAPAVVLQAVEILHAAVGADHTHTVRAREELQSVRAAAAA